jgi:hypothetical protein
MSSPLTDSNLNMLRYNIGVTELFKNYDANDCFPQCLEISCLNFDEIMIRLIFFLIADEVKFLVPWNPFRLQCIMLRNHPVSTEAVI